MNARTQSFELEVEGRQADEAVASIFHTVLFYRTTGKFRYTNEDKYTVGSVGYTDVDCNFIDLTYVCCSSKQLDRRLKSEIADFSSLLRGSESTGSGQISLEFFQRKRTRTWLFQDECVPWEVWTVRLQLIPKESESEKMQYSDMLGEQLGDGIFCVAEMINKNEFLPQMPNQSDLDQIFDTTYHDVQPYNFKVQYQLQKPSSGSSVGSSVKKLFRETLAF